MHSKNTVNRPSSIPESSRLIDEQILGSQVGCFRSQAEFQHFIDHRGGIAVSRWLIEKNLRHSGLFHGTMAGWSELIGGPTFYSFNITPESEALDLREQLVCAITGLPARVRFCMSLIVRLMNSPEKCEIYMTEQVTLAYRWLKKRYPNVKGSEYFDEESRADLESALQLLDVDNEKLRFEDVTNLSWSASAFDAVLSFDVLEHVPTYREALSEFFRVVKSGGYLVLTVPFRQDSEKTVIRAELNDDGSIFHHEEPDYHGDPVREDGVLCFQDFGWDLLDEVRRCGFRDALMALPWDYTQGLMGPLWTLVAKK